jgi:hypothetical protein
MRALPAALSAEYIEEDSRIVTKKDENRIRRLDGFIIKNSFKCIILKYFVRINKCQETYNVNVSNYLKILHITTIIWFYKWLKDEKM